jgi:hypothetical protein
LYFFLFFFGVIYSDTPAILFFCNTVRFVFWHFVSSLRLVLPAHAGRPKGYASRRFTAETRGWRYRILEQYLGHLAFSSVFVLTPPIRAVITPA